MSFVFTMLTWLLLFFSLLSLLTAAHIVFRVVRGTVDGVNLAIFSGTEERSASSTRRPGMSFVVILLFDLASFIAVLTVMVYANIQTSLSWAILIIVLLCYIIKMRYFIRVFHNLGVLDDDDLEDMGIGN